MSRVTTIARSGFDPRQPLHDPPARPPWDCSTCTDVGRKGYCAPARCYCGHETCHAFASYVDLSTVPVADLPAPKPARTGRSAWDDRGDDSWIDKL